ncbi:hypothetical protein [Geotoga petraea]|jgi:hypothetical protein|uniref:Uncharacterized protein n=1 Tax=Geotoga petraea TaxID=28234 RepID=A0A1G6LPE0_9BACT|nr:hypothetical protein [Geotoga petraea]SDC45142.1 hypothetical protein SAMN04488588_1104 [Geotoga petraea]
MDYKSINEYCTENKLDYKSFFHIVKATKLKPFIQKSARYTLYKNEDLDKVKKLYEKLPELLKQ